MSDAGVADSGLYERDFYAWTEEQSEALRRAASERSNLPVDWENVAEEIQSLGRSDKREITSRLETLIEHLLKLALSTDQKPVRGWKLTVAEQRSKIHWLLDESPSLRRYPVCVFADCYQTARERVAVALDVHSGKLPSESPFDLDLQILNREWFPEAGSTESNA